MPVTVVTPPQEVFYDTNGTPLDGGYIYIGEANQNPETNAISVYWDALLTQPAAQPIRTLNGFPLNNGRAGVLFVNQDYSLTLRDWRKRLVFTQPSADFVGAGQVANLLDWIGADPTGSNDNDSIFRAALAQSLAVFVPTGRWVLDGATAYALKDYHCIFGEGGPTAAAGNTSATGGSRLLLTGSASSAFVNDDVSTKLLHTNIRNLEMYSTGSYGKIFDLTGPTGCDFSNFDIETNQTTTTLFYSRKLAGVGEFSWVNKIVNCRWRIPDAATVYNIDTDMSDSPIMACEIGGGLGMILRGTGGVRVVGNIINNAAGGATAAGITVSVESPSGAQHEIVGNQIEVNGTGGNGYDILIDGDQGATPAAVVGTIITGNMFRSSAVSAPIHLKRTSGAQYNGGIVIDDNVFNVGSGTQTAVTFDRTYWTNVRVGTNNSTFAKDYGFLRAGRSNTQSEVTIASGAIDVHSSRHIVDTEGSASTDDLDTINGLQDGEIVILSPANGARDVVVKNGTGNITLPRGNFTMNSINSMIALIGTASGAQELFRDHAQPGRTFMPLPSFATPGDLSVTYTERGGRYSIDNNVCTWHLSLNFQTNAYTTASGVFSIANLPVTPTLPGVAASIGRMEGLDWQTGDKQITASVAADGKINLRYEADAGVGGLCTIAHFPPSSSFFLRISGSFIIA